MENKNYLPQKKYLDNSRKQLRVWVENEKYEQFKNKVAQNGKSIYEVINKFIEEYCRKE